MTTDQIDAIEQDLLAIVNDAGSEIPITQFQFRDQRGADALRALCAYQRLPVMMRRYRLEARLARRRSPVPTVLIETIQRPADWTRPQRVTCPRKRHAARLPLSLAARY